MGKHAQRPLSEPHGGAKQVGVRTPGRRARRQSRAMTDPDGGCAGCALCSAVACGMNCWGNRADSGGEHGDRLCDRNTQKREGGVFTHTSLRQKIASGGYKVGEIQAEQKSLS